MTATIMVVDDSALIRTQVKRVLKKAGYNTVEAVDGQDACEKFEQGGPLAMIVCDVNMPRMNGLELLEYLRGDLDTDVPMVMLTTEGRPEIVRRARELGSHGWLIKPVKEHLLLATVEAVLSRG